MPVQTNERWTPERDARLVQMVGEGFTMAQISSALGGPSRCAVAGRMKRLGLKSKNAPVRPVGPRKRREAGAPRIARQNPRIAGVLAAPKAKKVNQASVAIARSGEIAAKVKAFVEKPQPAPDQPPRMVALVDLSRTDCRWPIGDPKEPSFGFCGHPRETGEPYCSHHVRLAYAPRGVAA